MKNTVYQGLAFLAMMLSLAACQKSGPASNETTENGGSVSKKRISITATIPETITKVAMTQEDNGSGKPTGPVSLAWETGDEITISNGTDTEVFELKSIEGTKAIFEGNEITGSSFTITYSKLPDFKSQSQPANASTEGLGWEGKLSGVNAITDFTFSSEWANENGGGTFTQSSILRLRAKLPSGVASTVNGVTIKAFDVATGAKVNLIDDDIPQIAVTIAEPGACTETDVVTVYATMPAEDITVPSGKALLFSFSSTNTAHSVYTHYRPITSPITIAQGTVTPLNINCPEVATYANANYTDLGTASNPYLIGDKYQLKAMSGRLETTKTYFKLVDDIDMTNEAWTSLNASLDKIVALDGNNKGITHLSAPLFDDLNGEVKDLTIKDATVVAGNKITGILANTVKTGASTIENVDITGTGSSTSSVKASNYTGGLIGEIDASNTSIEGCDVTNTNVSGTLAGGVIGYANALVTMSYCTYSGGTVTASERYAAGFIGSVADNASVISDCSVSDASVKASKDRVGGFVGQFQTKATVKNSNVTDVNVESALSGQATNIGGFVGVQYGTCENCHVYGNSTVSTSNSTKNQQVNIGGFGGFIRGHASGCSTVATIGSESKLQIGSHVGGFAGILTNNSQGKGKLTKCFSSGNIYSSDRYVGGLVGKTEDVDPISMCYSISNVTASDNCGGLVGWVGSAIEISDSYATGDVKATGQRGGGLIGLVETPSNVTIRRCYASGDVSEKFSNGGLICRISNATCTVVNCAAWNSSVYASANGSGNWSTGAVVGVAFPKCTLTDNYRNPNMALTAYWVPASNFQHANVSASHPLTDSNGAEMTDSALASGQSHYPQYPYHGKVEAGKTLSQLASTTLGWSDTIWDFNSGDLPKLIGVN